MQGPDGSQKCPNLQKSPISPASLLASAGPAAAEDTALDAHGLLQTPATPANSREHHPQMHMLCFSHALLQRVHLQTLPSELGMLLNVQTSQGPFRWLCSKLHQGPISKRQSNQDQAATISTHSCHMFTELGSKAAWFPVGCSQLTVPKRTASSRLLMKCGSCCATTSQLTPETLIVAFSQSIACGHETHNHTNHMHVFLASPLRQQIHTSASGTQ